MSKYTYVEQLFIDFMNEVDLFAIDLDSTDLKPCSDFYRLMTKQESLTHPQSAFVIRLLSKYRTQIERIGLDCSLIDTPKWRSQFRVIDHSKRIFLSQSEDGELLVCVKHPYAYKESFEKSCERVQISWKDAHWDSQEKIKKYTLDAINVLTTKEFALQKKYEMSQDFLDLVEYVEQVYEDQEKYLPTCDIVNDQVVVLNCSEETETFFNSHKKNNVNDDMFLAKSMGFIKLYPGKSIIEKICSTQNTFFWIRQTKRFLDLAFELSGKTVITLTKDSPRQWIEQFLSDVALSGYDPLLCKVGFRTSNIDDPEFNNWVREKGLGGDLKQGKILIFKDKPPKWLIENSDDVNIVVSPGSFLPSSSTAQTWISQMPCVIFLGDVVPSMSRGIKIVEL